MRKSKTYNRKYFDAEAIEEAARVFEKIVKSQAGTVESEYSNLYVSVGDENWEHDDEAEFLADYKKATFATLSKECCVKLGGAESTFGVEVSFNGPESGTEVAVTAPSRADIQRIFDVFELHASNPDLTEANQSPDCDS